MARPRYDLVREIFLQQWLKGSDPLNPSGICDIFCLCLVQAGSRKFKCIDWWFVNFVWLNNYYL